MRNQIKNILTKLPDSEIKNIDALLNKQKFKKNAEKEWQVLLKEIKDERSKTIIGKIKSLFMKDLKK